MSVIPLPSLKAYRALLAEKPVAAVLFDAAWDDRGRRSFRPRFALAAGQLAGQAAFGHIDTDEEWSWDLLEALDVLNVPTVSYFQYGRLIRSLIGPEQDVAARVRR